ncbi:MAG: hypothetical protein CMN06_01660 [Roseibacillus sp.]|nr:hypothetical protein [Roseibacillus sp.]
MASTNAEPLIPTGILRLIIDYLEPFYLVTCTKQDPLPHTFLEDFHERLSVMQWQPLLANTLALESTTSIRYGSRDPTQF